MTKKIGVVNIIFFNFNIISFLTNKEYNTSKYNSTQLWCAVASEGLKRMGFKNCILHTIFLNRALTNRLLLCYWYRFDRDFLDLFRVRALFTFDKIKMGRDFKWETHKLEFLLWKNCPAVKLFLRTWISYQYFSKDFGCRSLKKLQGQLITF